MSEPDLIPFFMPSLAAILGNAEQTKGAALTEDEVVAIRDKATCIMMERKDSEQMVLSRGYRDVEPEDCWADWHRLRAQFAGGYLPKIILCAVGDAHFSARAGALVRDLDVEFEVREHEPNVLRSFASSRRLPDEELAVIGQHTHVAYISSPALEAARAPDWACKLLELVGHLFDDCGATGVKCESSGMAHARERWCQLANAVDGPQHPGLVYAFVVPLIGEESEVWSCGMHLLGRPDFIAKLQDLPPALADLDELQDLFSTFGQYLVSECVGDRYFASRNTFQSAASSPRVRAIFEQCDGYDEDDFFFNPFGRFRLVGA